MDIRYIRSSAAKNGIVLAQSQKPGRILFAGSRIRIVVGRGPR